MDIKNLVPVDYSNQRVLLTAQVAEVFNTTTERISHNFCENKQHFKEGEHFFKLTGAALRSFKKDWGFSTFAARPLSSDTESFRSPTAPFSRMANCLYLWTEQGTMLHCKMVNTDEAWKMLKDLIAFYFAHRDNQPPVEESLFPDEEPVNEAVLLERCLKAKFFAHLVSGEFFNCNFDDVKAALVAPDDKFNKLLAIADRIQNPDEKDRLLLQAAAGLA